MVVRGWYMTHFDRRDLLHSKKICLDGFCTFSDLYVLICEFSRFFRKFRLVRLVRGKNIFPTVNSEKFFQKLIFTKILISGKTMILQLHFGIFISGELPLYQECKFFEMKVVGFFLVCVYLFILKSSHQLKDDNSVFFSKNVISFGQYGIVVYPNSTKP